MEPRESSVMLLSFSLSSDKDKKTAATLYGQDYQGNLGIKFGLSQTFLFFFPGQEYSPTEILADDNENVKCVEEEENKKYYYCLVTSFRKVTMGT